MDEVGQSKKNNNNNNNRQTNQRAPYTCGATWLLVTSLARPHRQIPNATKRFWKRLEEKAKQDRETNQSKAGSGDKETEKPDTEVT